MVMLLLFFIAQLHTALLTTPEDSGYVMFNCTYISDEIEKTFPRYNCFVSEKCNGGKPWDKDLFWFKFLYQEQCFQLQPAGDFHDAHSCTLNDNHAVIELCGTNMTELEPGAFSCYQDVEYLHLSHNSLTRLDDQVFHGLNKVRHIWLNNNVIKWIHNNVFSAELESLELVDLSHNRLTNLEPWLFVLPSLRLLDTSYNHLEEFTNTMSFRADQGIKLNHSKSLTMNLNNNHFSYVSPDMIFDFLGVEKHDGLFTAFIFYKKRKLCLFFQDNPYICDCWMYDMHKVIMDILKWITFPTSTFYCHGPKQVTGYYLRDLESRDLTCDLLDNCPSRCNCTYITENKTIDINCSDRALTQLPSRVPDVDSVPHKDASININFQHNFISNLTKLNYLNRTRILNLSMNRLVRIDKETIDDLQHVEYLMLDNNRLETLPSEWSLQSWPKLKELSIHGNQFVCDCQLLIWLPNWLRRYKGKVELSADIICVDEISNTIYPLNQWTDFVDETCGSRNKWTKWSLIGTVSGCVVTSVLICVSVLYFLTRKRIIFLRRKTSKSLDASGNKLYDAFVCFAEKDMPYIEDTLVPLLESGVDPPYKLYLHYRDFQPGKSIVKNIYHGLEKSQRIIFVISNDFLKSGWCMFEFRNAVGNDPEYPDGVLLMVIKEDVMAAELGEEIRVLMNIVTYVKTDDQEFTRKITEAMPKSRANGVRYQKEALNITQGYEIYGES